jgi:hypothetical protein
MTIAWFAVVLLLVLVGVLGAASFSRGGGIL